ncbi:MAG: EF-hand domain-containing protein [Gammaproteobacteria bacterium]
MTFNKAMVLAFALSAAPAVVFAADKSDKSSGSSETVKSSGAGSSTEQWSSFKEVDKDSSGFIDQSEASDVQQLDFGSADLDGDQRLSRSEYEAAKRGGSDSAGGSDAAPKGAGGSAIPRHSGDTQPR